MKEAVSHLAPKYKNLLSKPDSLRIIAFHHHPLSTLTHGVSVETFRGNGDHYCLIYLSRDKVNFDNNKFLLYHELGHCFNQAIPKNAKYTANYFPSKESNMRSFLRVHNQYPKISARYPIFIKQGLSAHASEIFAYYQEKEIYNISTVLFKSQMGKVWKHMSSAGHYIYSSGGFLKYAYKHPPGLNELFDHFYKRLMYNTRHLIKQSDQNVLGLLYMLKHKDV